MLAHLKIDAKYFIPVASSPICVFLSFVVVFQERLGESEQLVDFTWKEEM